MPLFTVTLLFLFSLSVTATTVDFEAFDDGTVLSSEIAGLTFSNAVVLSSTGSLPTAVPPRSGTNVAVDLLGPVTLTYGISQLFFSGYFTYAEPITLTAFDSADNIVATATSAFSSNLAVGGDPGSTPNELLTVAGGSIARVLIQGSTAGSSFAMDDINFSAVPEPSTGFLMTGAIALLAVRQRFSRK